MFRQKTGSVVCASCGSLVGVNDDKCYNCGRRNPGLWGFGPVLRRFGNDFGFTTVIVYGCAVLYTLSLVLTMLTGGNLLGGAIFSILGPNDFARRGRSGQPARFPCSSRGAGGPCSAPGGCTPARCTSSST